MSTAQSSSAALASEQATDPVCGMTVNKQTAAGSFEYQGQTYFFCSAHCLEKFRADPERFITGAPEESIKPSQPQSARANTPVRCTLRFVKTSRDHVQNAAWLSNRSRHQGHKQKPS